MFYTLPDSLGEKWQFEYLHMRRERFELELLADVHRDHAIRNAIVVVVPAKHVTRYVRLGLAHAWREGVRRFILLFANHEAPSVAQTDELEQELRVLLDSLGDGGAAPALRVALTRCAGRTSSMKTGMLQLLDEIERVFPPDDGAPVLDEPLPASFAHEAALLDAIAPLVRDGTMIETRAATLEETAALRDGTGGSHVNGWPYLPRGEAWPRCPRCKRRIPCYQQFDMRDVLHVPPATHHLYVIYRCDSCYSPDNVVVRHYDAPTTADRWPIDLEAPLRDHPQLVVMERRTHMLPDRDIVEASHPDLVAKLRALDDSWDQLYWAAESALGMSSPRIPDHLGGWQTSQSATVPACACDTPLYLVSSTQWGDWWNSVWACPIHADLTIHTFEK